MSFTEIFGFIITIFGIWNRDTNSIIVGYGTWILGKISRLNEEKKK